MSDAVIIALITNATIIVSQVLARLASRREHVATMGKVDEIHTEVVNGKSKLTKGKKT